MEKPKKPIGVFDSGVGGLSVLKAIRANLPGQPAIYFADQEHVPYGPRSLEQVNEFTHAITRWLLEQGAGLIVVACNSASAASLQNLRRDFPDTPFVGMEPAVKPAAEQTSSGVVGVLATPATFQGALYASVVERFAQGVVVLQDVCPGLVSQIEAGKLATPETRAILEKAIHPMLARGIDTIVLGCTHYPFVIPLVRDIAGPNVRVIDPAPAVARQVQRLLEARGWSGDDAQAGPARPAMVRYITSGSPQDFAALLPLLLAESELDVEPCVEMHRI
jgi:glutamate racemase